MRTIKLDIGSGLQDQHTQLTGDDVVHADSDKNASHLEVQCDIQSLPFQSGTFTLSHAAHVIEHVEDPLQALRELRRVTRNRVVVKVPNAGHFKHRPADRFGNHLFNWNEWTLKTLLDSVFDDVKIRKTHRWSSIFGGNRMFRTLTKLLLMFEKTFLPPRELTATCKRRKNERDPVP